MQNFVWSAELSRWAKEHGCELNEYVCYYAAQGGHLEALQWARENGCPFSLLICRDESAGWWLATRNMLERRYAASKLQRSRGKRTDERRRCLKYYTRQCGVIYV